MSDWAPLSANKIAVNSRSEEKIAEGSLDSDFLSAWREVSQCLWKKTVDAGLLGDNLAVLAEFLIYEASNSDSFPGAYTEFFLQKDTLTILNNLAGYREELSPLVLEFLTLLVKEMRADFLTYKYVHETIIKSLLTKGALLYEQFLLADVLSVKILGNSEVLKPIFVHETTALLKLLIKGLGKIDSEILSISGAALINMLKLNDEKVSRFLIAEEQGFLFTLALGASAMFSQTLAINNVDEFKSKTQPFINWIRFIELTITLNENAELSRLIVAKCEELFLEKVYRTSLMDASIEEGSFQLQLKIISEILSFSGNLNEQGCLWRMLQLFFGSCESQIASILRNPDDDYFLLLLKILKDERISFERFDFGIDQLNRRQRMTDILDFLVKKFPVLAENETWFNNLYQDTVKELMSVKPVDRSGSLLKREYAIVIVKLLIQTWAEKLNSKIPKDLFICREIQEFLLMPRFLELASQIDCLYKHFDNFDTVNTTDGVQQFLIVTFLTRIVCLIQVSGL